MDRDPDATADSDTLGGHLFHLAMTVEDVTAFLTRHHEEGEIHPEALPLAEQLTVGLRNLAAAIKRDIHLEHLAMSRNDIAKMLTVNHDDHRDHTLT